MMDFESAAVPYLPIRRRREFRRRLSIAALAVVAFAVVVAIRHHQATEPIGERVFDQVVSTISVRYYDRDFHGLNWRAVVASYRPRVVAAGSTRERYLLLSEMLATLGDSHTAVFAPAQVSAVQDRVAEALGAAFVTVGGHRVVARVAPRSPAAHAGLRPGFIVAETQAWDVALPEALSVHDPLSGRSFRATLHLLPGASFDDVQTPAIDWTTTAHGVGYLRLSSFPNDIGDELGWAISGLQREPALVLDLRGNPGGLIDAVDATAGVFLPRGTLVVTGIGRYRLFGHRHFMATDDAGVRYDGRLAVIVDEHSESGAEALASALKIHRRAVIVGERTARHVLGVEVEEPLADGGLLRVATLDMRDAAGGELEGTGVTPDISVSRTPVDIARGRDPQLRAAIEAVVTR
jgi:carboxyl-terminal processing protease